MSGGPRHGRTFAATIGVTLSAAGVSCALTLVFLGMRSVMNVGGFCAEGGPYTIRQHCPQGVPAVMNEFEYRLAKEKLIAGQE